MKQNSSPLVGRVDGIDGRVVHGWVYSPNKPTSALVVRVYSDNELLGETTANLLRPDLVESSVGNGSCSFRYVLPLGLFNKVSHLISVRTLDGDYELPGSPVVLQSFPLPNLPQKSNSTKANGVSGKEPTILGHLDAVHGRVVSGWAYAPGSNSAVTVKIIADMHLVGLVEANLYRTDLVSPLGKDGRHAFRFSLPLEFFDGGVHTISVRATNPERELEGSPLTLQLAPLAGPAAFPDPSQNGFHQTALSDIQFVMLRATYAIAETLLQQSKTLARLLETVSNTSNGAAPPNASLSSDPQISPEEIYGPLLNLVRMAPQGQSDYVFFPIIDWHYRIQRPQHLARELAALGNRVFYLSVQFDEWTQGESQFRIVSQPAPGVFEIALRCTAPVPNIYEGIGSIAQIKELALALETASSVLKLASPIGIIQFPSWHPVAAQMPGWLVVHDCLDHVAGFNNVSPRVIELEDRLIKTADVSIVSSQYLANAVSKHRPCTIVRNGAEISYFSTRPEKVFAPERQPVIGYYGAIAEWFDIDLVTDCAAHHPEWQFILIGSVDGCDVSRAKTLDNVTFLGEKPYAELTQYLYSFDLCIIPFKQMELIQATNPVKIYEYLAAGKAVVATNMPELRLLPSHLVSIARSSDEFELKIAEGLRDQDPEAIKARRTWAARQNWSVRSRRFSGVIAKHFPLVSVIILCFNNIEFTRACLSSVVDLSDYPNIEIVCVDNASTDETSSYLNEMARRDNRVVYVRNQTNLGFSGGNNVGLKAAHGEICVLLNNDTYVTKGWLRDLIRPLLRLEDVGMSGPLTNSIGNEQKISINYADMGEMGRTSARFVRDRRGQIFYIRTLAFFCVAIRREVIEKVGYLDEEYEMGFFEDDDYCQRVMRAGYKMVVCDDVFVHHHLSASYSKLGADKKAELMAKNRKVYEGKWGPWEAHRYRDAPGFGE